jgi:hypothetical protein
MFCGEYRFYSPHGQDFYIAVLGGLLSLCRRSLSELGFLGFQDQQDYFFSILTASSFPAKNGSKIARCLASCIYIFFRTNPN